MEEGTPFYLLYLLVKEFVEFIDRSALLWLHTKRGPEEVLNKRLQFFINLELVVQLQILSLLQ